MGSVARKATGVVVCVNIFWCARAPTGPGVALNRVAAPAAPQRVERLDPLLMPGAGDFEPAFRQLLGERATLSASAILRLKADWTADYGAFRSRPIEGRFAYLWADGIYLGAGLEPEDSYRNWETGASAGSGAFSPPSGVGTYAISARLRNASAGIASVWSPEIIITVQ